MATDRQLAIDGCDDAYKECIKKVTAVLEDCLATAKDDAAKKECRARYTRGMRLCKEAHDINKEVVDELYPQKKKK